MWYLKNSKGNIIYLKPYKVMIVSRKDGYDIVLANDASISKLHASITVKQKINFKNNEPSSTVIVQDTGSKYGTFVTGGDQISRKLTKSEDHILAAADKVKFGLVDHEFTLHYVPLIISTSTLNDEEKIELQCIVDTLDGAIIQKWGEYCTHLTVSNVKLTTQVVQALVFGTPIVSLRYWNAVIERVERNEPLPEINDFIPSIKEGSINSDTVSLKINLGRKVLFKGLAFVSFSASQAYLKEIINYAGGKLMLFKEGRLTMKQLSSNQVVVLQIANDSTQPSQASSTLYDSIQESLQEKGRRLVPESDIFLAILYCSIEKYCNPKFDFKKLIVKSDKRSKALSSSILEPDTEDVLASTRNIPAVVIKETPTSSEQIEEQETQNLRKSKFALGKKAAVEVLRDSLQSAATSKKTSEKSNFGSEDSSREGALMIDETRSSIESDSNDAVVKRRDFTNEFDEPIDKLSTRRFNLQSKLHTSKISKKENLANETPVQIPGQNFISNSSTSRENVETSSRKRIRNASDQISKEKSPAIELHPVTKDIPSVKKTSDSKFLTYGQRSPKQSQTNEKNMFSFLTEGAAKRKRNARDDEGDDLFELLEDPKAKNSRREVNIFEKGLNKIKKSQPKRRRSSLSSNDSSMEEKHPEIKVEKFDSEDNDYEAPLIRCKKEFDNSMDETCKSTIMPLLRTDIDLTLDDSVGNLKTFVKVYTMIPEQRIKLKNMYVWKSPDETKYDVAGEDSTSSDDDENDDFKFHTNKGPNIIRRRK